VLAYSLGIGFVSVRASVTVRSGAEVNVRFRFKLEQGLAIGLGLRIDLR
jgi:hypothetical protein